MSLVPRTSELIHPGSHHTHVPRVGEPLLGALTSGDTRELTLQKKVDMTRMGEKLQGSAHLGTQQGHRRGTLGRERRWETLPSESSALIHAQDLPRCRSHVVGLLHKSSQQHASLRGHGHVRADRNWLNAIFRGKHLVQPHPEPASEDPPRREPQLMRSTWESH